uniref:Uncharacterized protein n=1 Tax=viral metagenome TaxID=1070528 RepID=A0A6M3X547_9ZZZZ
MSTWLKLLPLEIDGVEELIEPVEVLKGDDTVLGVICSEDLKKIWSLYKSLRKEAELLAVEQKYTTPTDEEKGKVAELATKARALELIFWIGVQDELQMWARPQDFSHYICAGWKVAEFKRPEMPFFPF